MLYMAVLLNNSFRESEKSEQQLQLGKIVTFNQGSWVGDEMRDKGEGGGSGEGRGGMEMKAGHILYTHDIIPLLIYIWGMARASFIVPSLSKPAESKRRELLQCLSDCLHLLVRRLKDDGRNEHPAGVPDASGFQLLEPVLR